MAIKGLLETPVSSPSKPKLAPTSTPPRTRRFIYQSNNGNELLSVNDSRVDGHSSDATHVLVLKNSFLTQLISISTRSNALAEFLTFQENTNTALPLQGKEALTLIGAPSQASRYELSDDPI